MSRTAVIVSTARTGLAKSFKGGFNATHGSTLAGHVIKAVAARAKVDPTEIDDVIMGVGFPENATGYNVARQGALWAGCGPTVPGAVASRFCASGLQAIANAAHHVIVDGASMAVGGGVENISVVQPVVMKNTVPNPDLLKTFPAVWMSMIETADIVAHRYKVSRERQDEFALQSQQRTAAAQAANLFADEIIPVTTTMQVRDKATGVVSNQEVTIDRDDCNRADTTIESLNKLKPIRGEGNFITAGNASQFSDGAAASLVMEEKEALRRGLEPMGIFRGFVSAGNAPDEMGIAPIYAIPKLLERNGLTIDDIDLWELNEAFASQSIYILDHLKIDPAKVNVNGGAISIGHPYGMSGARLVGHLMLEGKRRKAKWAVATMCVAQGQGCAGLFEIVN